MGHNKKIVEIVAVLLLCLFAVNLNLQPARATSAGASATGTILFPPPPLPPDSNMTQVLGASPLTNPAGACQPYQPESLVTYVTAEVALDAIGMDTTQQYMNWMGLAATSDNTNLNNAVEVGISVVNNNPGWQTPYVYFSSWQNGKNNIITQENTPTGLSLGQTIGVAVAQQNYVWHAYYNLNKGAGWQSFASNRTMNFNSLSYVFTSCESSCKAGYINNIFGQWSAVQYQYNNGQINNVYFNNMYVNNFNYMNPVNYYGNNNWYGEFYATG